MSRLYRQVDEICSRYRIDIMYAFGSRSREIFNCFHGRGDLDETVTPDLDIGIRVLNDSGLSVREKVNLTIDLEELLGVGRVDLVVLSEADPFLAANIIRGERIFCRNAYPADEYELYVLRRAGDFAPLERERLSMIFKEAT